MVIYLPTAVIFLYLLIRLILPLKINKKRKMALGLLLFVISQSHLLKAFFSGACRRPNCRPRC